MVLGAREHLPKRLDLGVVVSICDVDSVQGFNLGEFALALEIADVVS